MADAYFYNMTNKPVTLFLNGDPTSAKTIPAIKKDDTAGFVFSYVTYPRDSDDTPHGKFGTDNTVYYSVGPAKLNTISHVKDSTDGNEDIIVFMYYTSIVVKTLQVATLYNNDQMKGSEAKSI